MKTFFTYGAQQLINQLLAEGHTVQTRPAQEFCHSCGGAGCGCGDCNSGIQEGLWVYYTPIEQCQHCSDYNLCRGQYPCPREED